MNERAAPADRFSLKGQYALVIGGTSGIGLELAKGFLDEDFADAGFAPLALQRAVSERRGLTAGRGRSGDRRTAFGAELGVGFELRRAAIAPLSRRGAALPAEAGPHLVRGPALTTDHRVHPSVSLPTRFRRQAVVTRREPAAYDHIARRCPTPVTPDG